MSSDERRAVAFTPRIAPDVGDDNTDPQDTLPAHAWTPKREDQCRNCGAHVTPRFRKCLGDDDDVAHACRQCVDQDELYCGAAADPDWEKRVQHDGGDS